MFLLRNLSILGNADIKAKDNIWSFG